MKIDQSSAVRNIYLHKIRSAPRQLFAGIAIMLLSSLLGSLILRHEALTLPVLQATRAVAAGEFITTADLRIVYLPSSLESAQWATKTDLQTPQRLTRSIRPGQPLFQSDLGGSASGEVSFGFEAEAATLPVALETGETVQVWALGSADDFEAQLIVSSATLLEVKPVENRETVHITLRLAPQFLAQSVQMAADDRLRLVSGE